MVADEHLVYLDMESPLVRGGNANFFPETASQKVCEAAAGAAHAPLTTWKRD